jgi:hypothetical protein
MKPDFDRKVLVQFFLSVEERFSSIHYRYQFITLIYIILGFNG